MKQKFEGDIHTISSRELMKDKDLLDKMLALVAKVYGKDDAALFNREIAETPEAITIYMMLGNNLVGLGSICESHIFSGMYELFWGMIDEPYRSNGWGKILIDSRIEWVQQHCKGLSSPNSVVVVTRSPWHLTRCGFETVKQLNPEGDVLMCLLLNKATK